METACARNAIGWAMDVFGGRTSGRVEDDHVAEKSRISARWASSATRIVVLLVIY